MRRMEQAYGVKVKNPSALDQFEGIYAEDGEMEVDYLDGPPREFEFGFEDCHMEGENLVIQGTYTIIRDWVMEGMGTMKAVFEPNDDSFIWIFTGERVGEPVGNMRHSLDFGLCRFFELIFSA